MKCRTKACKECAILLEAKTDGRATIEIFPNGQLGDEAQLVEQVLLGSFDVAMTANSTISSYITDYRVFDLPFLFPTISELSGVLDGPVLGMLEESAEGTDLELLAVYSSGIRQIMTKEPINSMADL